MAALLAKRKTGRESVQGVLSDMNDGEGVLGKRNTETIYLRGSADQSCWGAATWESARREGTHVF